MYLSLNGVTIPNDSYVLLRDIGRDDISLNCNTDRSGCCRASGQGHWYHPDGSQVGSFTQEFAIDPAQNFFSRNRDSGVVRLHRNGNPTERGRFRCEIPNAAGDVVIMYVNIGEWFVSSSTVDDIISLCFILF